ncbi:MAG: HlyC/CorC family transporter [Bacteroidales bacterium]|nr:HlyC/CorC family transporter [Bacteroidales bacterium]
MILLIVYLVLAIAVSFLCSLVEAVLLSVSVPFLEIKLQEGKRSAKLLHAMKKDIDQPLAAILSINTIAHTVGAAGVGAQAVKVFGDVYFGLISAVLTILILFVSEIIPKTLGARKWRSLALPLASILKVMIFISFPLVVMARWITRRMAGKSGQHTVFREEIAALASLGMKEGIFKKSEELVIKNLIRLQTLRIRAIMTPRTVLVSASEEMPLSEFFTRKEFLQYSRIPVFSGNIDNITGYVLKYDVLEGLAKDEFTKPLRDIKREILISYENFTIANLLEQLLGKREHISLVVDEYGGVEGIVTLEDIFETMLGLEIMDETDSMPDLRYLARERWLKRAKGLNIRPSDLETQLPEE